jgi:hypothetical protein
MRLEAGSPGRAEHELASFLKSLTDSVATRPGVAIVATFASSLNAFGSKNAALQRLFAQTTGQKRATVDEVDAALAAGFNPVQSVLNRFTSGGITPVQPGEISFLLAKRLFSSIDTDAASEVAREYMDFYKRSAADLPESATVDAYGKRIETFYPFHPSFIDFLNDKLAASTDFQGTRGVLRVLALAVRSITRAQNQGATRAGCIHVTDLDLRDTKVAEQLVPGQLKNALNVDVGGPETGVGDKRSRASFRDDANGHSLGIPFHEIVWRAVFLNSLVEGKAFGITEHEAAVQVAFPGLAPSEVKVALSAITDNAWYLKHADGRYFAQPKANLNRVINEKAAELGALNGDDPAKDIVEQIVKTMITASAPFLVVPAVSGPADVADKGDRITLAIAPPGSEGLDVNETFFSNGAGQARKYQNAIIVLTPRPLTDDGEQVAWRNIDWQARMVVVRRRIRDNPVHYGIDVSEVKTADYQDTQEKKELALRQLIGARYVQVWFPHFGTGEIACRTITGSVDAHLTTLLKSLRESKDILSAGTIDQATVVQVMQVILTRFPDPTILNTVFEKFRTDRSLPMIEDAAAFVRLISMGVESGRLVLYRVPATEGATPTEVIRKDGLVAPQMPLISGAFDQWGVVSEAGARRRGWIGEKPPSDAEVEAIVLNAIAASHDRLRISQHMSIITRTNPRVSPGAFDAAVETWVHRGRLFLFEEQAQIDELREKAIPEDEWPLRGGDPWVLTDDQTQWAGPQPPIRSHRLRSDDWDVVSTVARSIGSLYGVKGAKSTVTTLSLSLSGAGAAANTTVSGIGTGNWRAVKELVDSLLGFDDDAGDAIGSIVVDSPVDGCPLAQLIRNANGKD